MTTATLDPVVLGDTTTCTGTGPLDSTLDSTTAVTTESTSTTTSTSTSAPEDTKDEAAAYPHHVIFVVHGMGRQLEEYGSYEPNVANLVENTKTVLQSTFHDLKTDVHIIPTEWHSKLHTLVDDRMSLTSLKTVPKVRMVVNDYLADILYYFNSHFGSIIVSMIVDELNEAYATFMAKHPDFNGKISIFALSLGGVAMYDILTCQDDDIDGGDDGEDKADGHQQEQSTQEQSKHENIDPAAQDAKAEQKDQASTKKQKPKVRKQDQANYRIAVPKLKFRPHYLFTVGSPVGAVLVMRNLEWETFHPPEDIIHHNLFHPFDPLGYRIEPLIDPVFAKLPATLINSYNSSQSLFPSISLPSLPSLLPGSISLFWENNVPALPRPSIPNLPRPSIPSLSDLSQMTQSLKAGRWLSGTGSGTGANHSGAAESSGEESAATTSEPEGERITDGEGEGSVSSASSVSEHDAMNAEIRKDQEDEAAMLGDASVSECMAAVTVATYLDQKKRSRPTVVTVDTRTGFADDVNTTQNDTSPTSTRGLNLGPRRVSNRIENDHMVTSPRGTGQLSDVMEQMVGITDGSDQSEEKCDTSIISPSHMDMEYYIGMENRPTAEEKARGLGAKSNVVREPLMRSSPTVSPSSQDVEAQQKTDNQGDGQDTNGSGANRSSDSATDGNKGETRERTVHVEGRATKLPYRIDHVLQETTADQYTNEYLLSMRSHFKYWASRDIAYHILKTMLEPQDPSSKDTVLDLKLGVPAPISPPRAPKAAARQRTNSLGTSGQKAKNYNRRSFAFSFFGGYESSSLESHHHHHQQQQQQQMDEIDSDIEMMDEEGELFGYRYRYSDSEVDNNNTSLGVSSVGTQKSRITQSVSYVNIESKYKKRSTRVVRKPSSTSMKDSTLVFTSEVSAEAILGSAIASSSCIDTLQGSIVTEHSGVAQ